MSKYNYTDIIEEIEEDINSGVITLEDNLFIIRTTEPKFEDYRPILDYEYDDIEEGSCEKMRVSWILKEMRDMNSES
jgi:hypothetical protein